MSTSLRPKTSLISVTLVLILASYYGLIFFTDDNKSSNKSGNENNKAISLVSIASNKKTVATTWQWEDSSNIQNKKKSSAFSEKAVYHTLRRVRLDSQDNIIIDHEALIALNATLNDSRLQLDEQSLHDLQMIIMQGLPGSAGADVAKIVADYYHYLIASKEFEAIYATDPATLPDIENTIETYQEKYHELTALRELYLGSDTAEKLFSTSNANANYMFDMLNIEQDGQLADEEKLQKYNEIINRHAEQTIAINSWNQRYNRFQMAKKNILSAVLSNEDKQTQVTELMLQHFNHEELTHVRHLQLESPTLLFGIE